MACCILAALVISQVVLAWERCRAWLGLGKPESVSAADWRPGITAIEATSPSSVATRSPFRRRLALVLALQVSLGVLLGLHWTHLGAELRTAGAWLGVVEADPALCNVPPTGATLSSSRVDLAADPRLAPK